MMELPEAVTIAGQMNAELRGRRIASAERENSPHKWVFYNRPRADYERILPGKVIGQSRAEGSHVNTGLTGGLTLQLGDGGERIFLHEDDTALPEKHLQDILFRAGLHPRRKVRTVPPAGQRKLYHAIRKVLTEAIAKGGRDDELDLFARGGRYVRQMDRRAKGRPCPQCGTPVEKIQYLGGACYLCPTCQPAP